MLEEPILPTLSDVKSKYRKGTFLGRLARYFAEKKNMRKVFAAGFSVFAVATILTPQSGRTQVLASENVIIESQTNLVTEKGMIYPVGQVKINQGYGVFHKALDLGGTVGTPVDPIMPGVVAYAGWDRSGYGNLIVLEHKNGVESYYAHLSKIEVNTGDEVNIGEEIGKMGATGHATGTHLHLEIHQNGVFLNPLTVLSK